MVGRAYMYYSQDIIYRIYVRNDSEKAHAAASEILHYLCGLRKTLGSAEGSISLNGRQLPAGKNSWPSPVDREFVITARLGAFTELCLYNPELMEKIDKLQNGSYAAVIYSSRYNSLIGCFGAASKIMRPLREADGDSWVVNAPFVLQLTAPKNVWADAVGFVSHSGRNLAEIYENACKHAWRVNNEAAAPTDSMVLRDQNTAADNTMTTGHNMVAEDQGLRKTYQLMAGEIFVEDARSIYRNLLRDICADLEIRLFDLCPAEAGRACGNEVRKLLSELKYNVTSVDTVPGDAIRVSLEVKPYSRLYARNFFRIERACREMSLRRGCRLSVGNGTPVTLTGEYTAVRVRPQGRELAFELEEVIPANVRRLDYTACHPQSL